jgi:hypothetical protein
MKPINSITMGDKTVTRIASLTTLRLDGRTNQQKKKKNRQTKTLPTLFCFSFSSLTRSWWMQYKIVLINHIHILQTKKIIIQWQWLSHSIKLTPGGCRAPCKKQMMGTDTILSKEWVMNNIPTTDRGLIASSPEPSLPQPKRLCWEDGLQCQLLLWMQQW